MASRDQTDVIRAPGRLYLNGTELGIVRAIHLDLVQTQFRIHLEEYDETGEVILGGQRYRLFTILRQWNDDALTAVFPNVEGTTGKKGVAYPGSIRAGRLASAHAGAGALVYAPNDPVNHPRVVFRRALPLFDEEMRLYFSIARELGIPVMFEGIRDAGDKGYDIGFGYALQFLLLEDDMGLQRTITGGATSQSTIIRIVDATTGAPEEGVTFETTGLSLWYRREGAAVTAITPATLASASASYSSGGIVHLDDGYYRVDVPNAAFTAGVAGVQIGGTVTGMVVIGTYHPIA